MPFAPSSVLAPIAPSSVRAPSSFGSKPPDTNVSLPRGGVLREAFLQRSSRCAVVLGASGARAKAVPAMLRRTLPSARRLTARAFSSTEQAGNARGA